MTDDRNTRLGDMMVVGNPPAKLWKALAVIADALHPSFELEPRIAPGISKSSCVICALTVRDFLRAIGFDMARVAPVCAVMWASENGKQLHSLGIGHPDDDSAFADRWSGHLVVVIGAFLIDATLYGAQRPQWPDL